MVDNSSLSPVIEFSRFEKSFQFLPFFMYILHSLFLDFLLDWIFLLIQMVSWSLYVTVIFGTKFQNMPKKFPFQDSFFLNKNVFGLLHSCLLLSLSDYALLVKQLLRQLPMVRRFETRLMVLEYVIMIDKISRVSVF